MRRRTIFRTVAALIAASACTRFSSGAGDAVPDSSAVATDGGGPDGDVDASTVACTRDRSCVFVSPGQYAIVPDVGCATLTVLAWGAGGGSGRQAIGLAGAGGAVGGKFTVYATDHFQVEVGYAGDPAAGGTAGAGGPSGGGSGGQATLRGGGGGGGYSGIIRRNIGERILLAGGGGGTGGGVGPLHSAGGGGGQMGGSASPGGAGGSENAGGVGDHGEPGAALRGGAGASGGACAGGGGGGGGYGGGGGAGNPDASGCTSGGGGSSYVGAGVTVLYDLPATSTPPNIGPEYQAFWASPAGMPGNHGRVVLWCN